MAIQTYVLGIDAGREAAGSRADVMKPKNTRRKRGHPGEQKAGFTLGHPSSRYSSFRMVIPINYFGKMAK
jgi:hypothetical protein